MAHSVAFRVYCDKMPGVAVVLHVVYSVSSFQDGL
jgi:hypothetical protein